MLPENNLLSRKTIQGSILLIAVLRYNKYIFSFTFGMKQIKNQGERNNRDPA